MAQWPLALTGSYWLQVSIIVGAIAVAIRMRPPLARVGALFAVLWIVLLAVWIGANLGIMAAFSLSPIYFFLMMYPFWAFFSLYAGVWLIEITTSRFVPKARSADPRLVCAALCVAAVALIPLFHADVSRVFKWGGVQSRAATPITQALRENIALRPGQTYRGSVATLLGSPGSPLRRQLLVEAEQPLKPYEFERFLQKLAADTGSTHDLLDLWWLDIPTLSEYGQGLSKPLLFYLSNVLNAPADAHDLTLGLPRLANIDILRAMGVRFIITDLQLRAKRARMTQVLPLSGGIALYLYELSDPNVAGFSPLKLSGPISPAELLQRIASEPALFESEAFVDSPTAQNLVPVERSQVVFERGAVHVTARSTGRPRCCCRCSSRIAFAWRDKSLMASRCCAPTCSTRSSCSSGSWISGCDGNSVSGATADAACATPRMSAHSAALTPLPIRDQGMRVPHAKLPATMRR